MTSILVNVEWETSNISNQTCCLQYLSIYRATIWMMKKRVFHIFNTKLMLQKKWMQAQSVIQNGKTDHFVCWFNYFVLFWFSFRFCFLVSFCVVLFVCLFLGVFVFLFHIFSYHSSRNCRCDDCDCVVFTGSFGHVPLLQVCYIIILVSIFYIQFLLNIIKNHLYSSESCKIVYSNIKQYDASQYKMKLF